MKAVFRAFAALLAVSFASCAQAPAQEADGIHPLLYVVRDADSTMYLYGTVHVRPRGSDWGNDRVRAALNESSEIWTELMMNPETDAQTQSIAMRLGRAEPGHPLSSWLTPEENAALNAVTTRLGMPQGALEGMKGSAVRVTDRGAIIVSVAVPVQHFRAVRGALMLTTQGDAKAVHADLCKRHPWFAHAWRFPASRFAV